MGSLLLRQADCRRTLYQLMRTNAAVGELVEHTRALHGEQLAPVAMTNLRVLGKTQPILRTAANAWRRTFRPAAG